jgi:MFS transporter, UMF1 family
MKWEEPRKPRWFNARMLAWSVFDVGTTIFSMLVISRYAGPYIKHQMGGTDFIYNVAVSVAMALSGILQILLSPVSDELGRRRIFVIGFTILCLVPCYLLSGATTLKGALLLFVIANIGFHTAEVFYNAMLGDVADEQHRARVSGIGIGLGYVGSIVGLLVSQQFVDVKGNIYSPVFVPTTWLMLAFCLPLFLLVKEKPSLVHLNLADSLKNSVGSFLTTLRRIGRHKEMLFFFIGCLLALDAVQTLTVNMTLCSESVLGMDPSRMVLLAPEWGGRTLFTLNVSELNLFLILSTSFAMVGAPIIGMIADWLGHYRTLMGVLILWIIALCLAMFAVRREISWIVGPLFGLGFGGIWTVSRAYLLDLCHPEERGQMFAIYGLVGKGAAILGPLAWGMMFSFSSEILELDERKSYRVAIATILLLLIAGFLVLRKAKPQGDPRV